MNARFLLLATILGITACTPKMADKLTPYKLTVVQGTPLEANHVLALQEGMTREQVQMEIGSPLLNQSFRSNRWDYVYEIVKGGKVKESRSLTVYFDNDRVIKIEGSALDDAKEQLQNIQQQEK